MATTTPLIGPPSLRDAASGRDDEKAIRGFTENMAATFLTTRNPCLDFFFKVVPNTPAESLIESLEIAWAFKPLMTLKLICNLRGVRGTGKSDKEGFYTAALWLHHVHPKTLAGNVKAIAEFGYFKDFLEILYRILEGPTVRETQKSERQGNRRRRGYKRSRRHYHGIENQSRRYPGGGGGRGGSDYEYQNELENEDQELSDYETNEDQQLGDYETNEDQQLGDYEYRNELEIEEKIEKKQNKKRTVKTPEDLKREEEARALRKEKERSKAKKALEMYNRDEDYRLLHDSVSGFFHELLMADLEKLKSGKPNEISLAAKWCPSIDSSYDKATLICESIARKMFPREKYPEYEGLEERHYAYRVRDRLRKEVLVPLHKALELPEVYMSANKWNTLPYNRVPSVAMKKYQKLFSAHDKERFVEYLENVKSGKAKIAAGALLPHEIIGSVEKEEEREVAELQWKRLVDDMIQKGKLSNCIAVCDVSGSMEGEPMEVSVALGILVSELSEEPWKGKLITFSQHPEIQTVQGESLLEKTEFVRNMDLGGSTNFQGVFDRILEVAVEEKLKDEQLVKRVFVFSDMEFNEASTSSYETMRRRYETDPWETDYQAIQRKYSQHGYKSVPEIVFWNLRDSRSIPVTGKQTGVALVSGFSKNLLKIFLDGGEIANPAAVMEFAVAGEEYQKLTVFD